MQIFESHCGDFGRLRWDEEYIRPASTTGVTAFSAMQERILSETIIEISLAGTGDTLLVDNWRMLHGRSKVPPECAGRIIERVYLEELW